MRRSPGLRPLHPIRRQPQKKVPQTPIAQLLSKNGPTPFIGIYDTFSAALAAQHFPALFVSGFSFGASHYGLPDIGFIAWSDLVDFVLRIRRIVPNTPLLVDMDDGFGDAKIASHVTLALEQAGATGIVLEDQRRPRRCGHLGGKEILPLEEYLDKLSAVLETRRDLFVVARTDAGDEDEVLRRVAAFEKAGADAVLADGILSLETLRRIRETVSCPIAFNQMAGGKSPVVDLAQLGELGANVIIYSTPTLFAAQKTIGDSLALLKSANGSLSPLLERDCILADCNSQLEAHLTAAKENNRHV